MTIKEMQKILEKAIKDGKGVMVAGLITDVMKKMKK